MSNSKTEQTKELRKKTSHEWITKKTKEGGYNFNVLITDKELATIARSIDNKRQFLINAIKEFMNKKHA
jgi:hypothetical protein